MERDLLRAAEPHQAGYRAQFRFGGLFADHLTVLSEEHGDHLWLTDDDLVALVDGGTYDPRRHATPWAANVGAARALSEHVASREHRPIASLRLRLCEGTERMGDEVQRLGLEEQVSHLALHRQAEGRELPLAQAFPSLRGLSCAESLLPDLLAEGAPSLSALVVQQVSSLRTTLELAQKAPQLRHLGLWHLPVTHENLSQLVQHPVMDRITSLDLWSPHCQEGGLLDAVFSAVSQLCYLRRLGLPGHLASPETRTRFRDWPEVDLIGYDRRQVIALDLETVGFPLV